MQGTKRRDVLGAVATTGLAALAGCSGSDSSGEEEPDLVVEVGPGGELRYSPAETTVAVGATVQWAWQSGGHTVTVASQPDGGDWEGTGSTTHDSGYTLQHTFDTAGTYEYYCEPHQGSGMVGTLDVGESSGANETTTDGGY